MDAKQRANVIILMMMCSAFNCVPFLAPDLFAGGRVVCLLEWWQFAEVGVLINHMDTQPTGLQPFD